MPVSMEPMIVNNFVSMIVMMEMMLGSVINVLDMLENRMRMMVVLYVVRNVDYNMLVMSSAGHTKRS